jgi:hypothetical protein
MYFARIYIVLAVVCVSADVRSVSAQSLIDYGEITYCGNIKNNAQRLKCYDEFVEKKVKERKEATNPPPKKSPWFISEGKKSPLDDSPQVSASINADDTGALLILRCQERRTEAVFAPNPAISPEGAKELFPDDSVEVIVRIGSGQPFRTTWSRTLGKKAAIDSSAMRFIQQLPDNEKIFLRALGIGGWTFEGTFNLGNVSEVRKKISLACDWA